MKPDPRCHNAWFDDTSIANYFDDYKRGLSTALESVSTSELKKAHELMSTVAERQGTFFVVGNGGSSSISDHICCDWTKGTFTKGQSTLRATSLCSNVAVLSAIANDFGYDQVFAQQLRMMARPGDALLAISSSGNSSNIVNAIETAIDMGLPSLVLTGFSGGTCRKLATISLHVQFDNYAIIEDTHQAILQALAQFFFLTPKTNEDRAARK
jgi:phosphoheptose isomerase